MKNNFCPAPWTAMFYHTDGAKVCCASKGFVKCSPLEFSSSEHVKQIRAELAQDKQPADCENCYLLEKDNHLSVRQTAFLPRINLNDYVDIGENTKKDLEYLEIRASNLCNFSCRMCGPADSNQIGKEIKESKYNIGKFYANKSIYKLDLEQISDEYFDQILSVLPTVKHLLFTGGEPMIIKQYNDILDHAVESGYNKTMSLQFHTNASVYNNHIVERLKQFKTVRLTLSLDAVGDVAEYQRYGTKWNQIVENSLRFVKVDEITTSVNMTTTAYTILDYYNTCKFFIELNEASKNRTYISARVASWPYSLTLDVLNEDLRQRALSEIEKSLQILPMDMNYQEMRDQCLVIKNILLTTKFDQSKFNNFVEFTKILDLERNQSFNDTFNYKLY